MIDRKRFSREVLDLGIPIRTAVEIGPNIPEVSQVLPIGLARPDTRTILVEPQAKVCELLRHAVARHENFTIIEAAIAPKNHTGDWIDFVEMLDCSEVSYLKGVHSPVLAAPKRWARRSGRRMRCYPVLAMPFGLIDDGTIDVLSIDCEGAEWHVLDDMTSRPKILSIEIGACGNNEYHNEHEDRIRHWLEQNGYRHWYSHDSDEVFHASPDHP